jgi:alanine dehydrogenase
MRVGIPTEIKNNEFRVAITPAGVAELVHRGHEVIIQAGAGEGSAISDADFKRAGAQMIAPRRSRTRRCRPPTARFRCWLP